MKTGYDYSWFILTEDIIKRVCVIGFRTKSDLTNKDIQLLIKERLSKQATSPVNAFMEKV